MSRRFTALFSFSLTLLLVACSGPANLHQVDEHVWRSGQPTEAGFRQLADEQDIEKVLNLRSMHSDHRIAGELDCHRIPMKASQVDEEGIYQALRVLVSDDEPTLVHCWHGSDRTGVVIASYRMVVQGWPRERAIAEFTDPKYGYHANWFPNLLSLLEDLDVEAMRSRLGLDPANQFTGL